MTNYSRGANFERDTKKVFEELGYYVVRSAGSHGLVDLVALKKDNIFLIQCKKDGYLTVEDREELNKLGNKLGLKVILAKKGKSEIIFE